MSEPHYFGVRHHGPGGARRPVRRNLTESPLGGLARLKDRAGAAYYDAGGRLPDDVQAQVLDSLQRLLARHSQPHDEEDEEAAAVAAKIPKVTAVVDHLFFWFWLPCGVIGEAVSKP